MGPLSTLVFTATILLLVIKSPLLSQSLCGKTKAFPLFSEKLSGI